MSTATNFDIDLDNIIILPPWKFRDVDPHETAAVLILRSSSVCDWVWGHLNLAGRAVGLQESAFVSDRLSRLCILIHMPTA